MAIIEILVVKKKKYKVKIISVRRKLIMIIFYLLNWSKPVRENYLINIFYEICEEKNLHTNYNKKNIYYNNKINMRFYFFELVKTQIINNVRMIIVHFYLEQNHCFT